MLDEIHERILTEIPDDDWIYAREALLWIFAHDELPSDCGFSVTTIFPAVFSDLREYTSDETYSNCVSTLHEICGCVITTLSYENSVEEFEFESLNGLLYDIGVPFLELYPREKGVVFCLA
ncbi:hypothetical protein CC78DRAFT_579690 [Lojkania enalia]|uniref:Uncharacterized protein n=1 Tax=Lojkania enalia TaxID=147567 RepID=A0A9P4KAF4_9PLEO|nr:hypothetical protein CC78DRAFT_579690 [Didymosphaeria enalia]